MINKTEYFDEPLARHTTFRIGGPAKHLLIPPDKKTLIETLRLCRRIKTPFFILGRGSNTLVSDEGIKGIVIKNSTACTELEIEGRYVKVGSSVPLQKLVSFCVKNNLYGMEYLYSVPGNVGGAICMNAGRGEIFKQSISDYLISVEIFDGQIIKTITKESCAFEYRTSIFHKKKEWFILSAKFDLPRQKKEVGKQKIEERLKLVREQHDFGYPSAGTVFKRYFHPLAEITGYRIGNAQFSIKTPGWIINLGGATFKDVSNLIKYARKCHKRRGLRIPELELVIIQQFRWERISAAINKKLNVF